MLPESTKIISVDDHVVEPPHVWQEHMPAKFKADGPRIVEGDDGAQNWVVEDKVYPVSIMGSPQTRIFHSDGRGKEVVASSYDDTIPAAYDPKARLEAMDVDGVWAELNFPSSFPRFAGTRWLEIKDHDLGVACVEGYNNWMIDEWCATDPNRFLPLIMTPLFDPVAGAAEIRRCAEKGAKGITFTENPAPLGLPSFWTDHWDPVFDAAQETGLPLCVHIGTSGSLRKTAPEAISPAGSALAGVSAMMTVGDMIFSGILNRFPDVKVALSEGGSGWAAYLLERMDYTWARTRFEIEMPVSPSEMFQKHFWTCFISDDTAIEARYAIGVDKLTFETDFPHNDSNYPNARKLLAESLRDVPDEECVMIAETNARQLFDFWN